MEHTMGQLIMTVMYTIATTIVTKGKLLIGSKGYCTFNKQLQPTMRQQLIIIML